MGVRGIDSAAARQQEQAREVRGADKPLGQENAALQHARRERRQEGEVAPAVVVERGRASADSAPEAYTSRSARAFAASEGGRPGGASGGAAVKLNLHVRAPAAGLEESRGAVELGEGASLKLNVHADRSDGPAGGRIALGEGASLRVNAHVGLLSSGGGTLVVAPGAALQVNLHAEHATAGAPATRVAEKVNVKILERVEEVANSPAIAGPLAAATPGAAPAKVRAAEAPAPELKPAQASQESAPLDRDALRQARARGQPENEERRRGPFERPLSRPEDPRWRLYRDVLAADERARTRGGGGAQSPRGDGPAETAAQAAAPTPEGGSDVAARGRR